MTTFQPGPPTVISADQLVHHEPIDEPETAKLTEQEREEASVGPQSPLSLLRGKRAELERELFYDLQIPRWDQILGRALWVRFKPASAPLLDAAITRRRENHERAVKAGKVGDPDWLIRANADCLVDACVAVYDLAVGEEPPTDPLPGNLPTFASPELSEALDSPGNPCPRNAVGTCLHLYGTSSDVLMASQQLLIWSGQASKEADRSFLAQ